ncbi:hypothetical protein [Paenibacillus sp. TH7-28]
MHTESTRLKNVLGEIETLRMKQQRELADRAHAPWKRFTQQELNDEACPTYKNLLIGRSHRIPDRQTIIDIAEYLECTSGERNDLLLTAGYLPIQTELAGRALELALEWAQQTMKALPYPAMIVTHTQDIKGYNEPFRQLFAIPSGDTPLNRIDLHFNADLSVRPRSTFDQTSFEQWESHAIQGIQAFKRNHALSRYDAWYQQVIHLAQKYNVIEKYDHKPDAEEEPERTQTILAGAASSGELIPIRYRQMSISAGSRLYPQIQVFLPVDAYARKVFADLGCPADCQFGWPPR